MDCMSCFITNYKSPSSKQKNYIKYLLTNSNFRLIVDLDEISQEEAALIIDVLKGTVATDKYTKKYLREVR